LTIISTGIADGTTATGIVSQWSDSNIRAGFGMLSCEC
jgi:hypothetical protein